MQLVLTVRNTGKQLPLTDMLLPLVRDKFAGLSAELVSTEGHFGSTNLSLFSMTAPLTLTSNFGSYLPGGGAQPVRRTEN